jgi:RimJ/RimL family protein N-acetyltransferase
MSSHRGVGLRPIAETDLPFLFRLLTDPARCHLWFHSRGIYDEQQFHDAWAGWTSGSMAAKFVVERRGRAAGLLFDYDRNLADGHTKMTALLEEKSIGRGAGVIATTLFMDWLFRVLPVRKIYHEVFSYNPAVVSVHRNLGLAEEGILRGHRFWDGSLWDLHVFAYHRAEWPRLRDRVLRRGGARPLARSNNGAPASAGRLPDHPSR